MPTEIKDMATCSECKRSFSVTRYGFRVPCPYCQALLDIGPDDEDQRPIMPRADLQRALHTKIEWLQGLMKELEQEPESATNLVDKIRHQIYELRIFLKKGR